MDLPKVKKEHVGEEDKYSVDDAVWIATALMAAEQYSLNSNVSCRSMYFKQADIMKKAKKLTKSDVNPAKVSWGVNADNEKHTLKYLRADSILYPKLRRLTMMDEFTDKTYPKELDMSGEFELCGSQMTMKELFSFVKSEYPKVIKKIDYKGVLDFLKNSHEVTYSNPEADGLAPEEKERLLNIKSKGNTALEEMKQIAARCEKLYGLDEHSHSGWVKPNGKETQKYLWSQLKYKGYKDIPISISLFVEKDGEEAKYRISLEIKEDEADEKTMETYHTHLEIQKEDDMAYVSGSYKSDLAVIEKEKEIKKKIASGVKVQLCIYVKSSKDKTNEEYDKDVMDAVERLIPYYKHVIGKIKNKI